MPRACVSGACRAWTSQLAIAQLKADSDSPSGGRAQGPLPEQLAGGLSGGAVKAKACQTG